tara:strand:+ start:206 stop:499 length:294 start_codon:yes stop_codon:yes gene_type:complete
MNTYEDEINPNDEKISKLINQNEDQNLDSLIENNEEKKELKEVIHLNSLITKNISLFTKNPNYKLLAWLLTQLFIFSLFILAVTVFKNNLIPYLNSL